MGHGGLHMVLGTADFMRNPEIQGLLDNLQIADEKFEVFINKIDGGILKDHVSTFIYQIHIIYNQNKA